MLGMPDSLYFLEKETKFKFHFIKKGSAESITQVIVGEMVDVAPKAIIAVTVFRNKTMDMRISLEISSKGMRSLFFTILKFDRKSCLMDEIL